MLNYLAIRNKSELCILYWSGNVSPSPFPNSPTIQIVVKNCFNRRHSTTATACKSMKHHLRLKFYNFFLKWEHHLLTKKPGKFFFSRAQISIFIIRRLQYIRWRRHFLLLSSIPYWPSIIRPNGLFFWTVSKLLVFRRRFCWRTTPTVSESLQWSLYGQWMEIYYFETSRLILEKHFWLSKFDSDFHYFVKECTNHW